MANESEISMNRVMYEAMFPTFINGPIKKNPTVVDAVRLMYVNWKDADLEDADYVDSLLQMVGDQLFVCPTDQSARAYSHSSASVYLYHMTHIPSKSIWRLKWMRAAHAEDLPFVFGWHFYHSEDWTMTPEEVKISLQIIKYWTNFAKTGNPNNSSSNGESSEESSYSEWLPFKVPGLSYKDLSTTMENNEGLKAMECSFWNDFIPKLVNLTDGDPVTSGQQRTKFTLNTFLFLLYYGFLAALYSVRM
ncbi:acetylcholinesterase-like [Ptychodera flava]|uniref:acetylcholinesterase-like n=1 Tax=Ptychodera flava TaxID=63121 RepID=UPI003969EE9C